MDSCTTPTKPSSSASFSSTPGPNRLYEQHSGKVVINDPVHGYIALNRNLFKFIDHPIFQRLRDLKQLGGMYYVFPGASHNRFEHSIGTSYLSGYWLRCLKENSSDECSKLVDDRNIYLVEVAGLCHDLGHGPFSHTFEDCFVSADVNFDHENVSVELLKLINKDIPIVRDNNGIVLDDHDQPRLSDVEIQMVSNMITGEVASNEANRFLYEIVHNQETGIDVDKFDYLARDCKNASLPLGFESARLLSFSKIVKVDDQFRIVFDRREGYNLFQMFATRFSLHKQIYSHRVVKAVELMIGDILKKADKHFKLTETLKEMNSADENVKSNAFRTYATFTDSLINEINRSNPNLIALEEEYNKLEENVKQLEMNDPNEEMAIIKAKNAKQSLEEAQGLAEAKRLVQRLFKRELYKYFFKVSFKSEVFKLGRSKETKQIKQLINNMTQVYEGKIDVKNHKIKFGDLHNAYFFEGSSYKKLALTDICGILEPVILTEESVRFFSKESLEFESIGSHFEGGLKNFTSFIECTHIPQKTPSSTRKSSASNTKSVISDDDSLAKQLFH